MKSSATRFPLWGATMIVLLGACSSTDPESSQGSASDSSEAPLPSETSTGAPPMEPGGPESPGQTMKGAPALSIAQLPVGVSENYGQGDSGAPQGCITVNWLGKPPIPEGVAVSVSSVRIAPGGVLAIGGGCDGEPACTSFTFTAQSGGCAIDVTRKRSGGGLKLTLDGEPHCRAGQQQKCVDLKAHSVKTEVDLEGPDDPVPAPAPKSSPSPTS